jgi:hypothetical protein
MEKYFSLFTTVPIFQNYLFINYLLSQIVNNLTKQIILNNFYKSMKNNIYSYIIMGFQTMSTIIYYRMTKQKNFTSYSHITGKFNFTKIILIFHSFIKCSVK